MKRFLFLALTAVAYAARTIVPSEPTLDSDGCYAISTAEQLYGYAKIVNESEEKTECGKLTKDIVVNEKNVKDTAFWTPIESFHGTFDGQNHTISGLICTDTSAYNVGMFGYVGAEIRERLSGEPWEVLKKAVVKNLGLINVSFVGKGAVGGIAGGAWGAVITNCYVDGAVYSNI